MHETSKKSPLNAGFFCDLCRLSGSHPLPKEYCVLQILPQKHPSIFTENKNI
jgi:hypothetical protein